MAESVLQLWDRAEAGAVSFSLGGERIAVERAEVDRLVRGLRQSELPSASSICEEISARALIGRVELCPTEVELDVLVSTLERLRGITGDESALRRLLVLCRALRDCYESAAAVATPLRAAHEAGQSVPPVDGRTDEL